MPARDSGHGFRFEFNVFAREATPLVTDTGKLDLNMFGRHRVLAFVSATGDWSELQRWRIGFVQNVTSDDLKAEQPISRTKR